MTALAEFVEMAHRIVWCTVATVGPDDVPRTRILHPIWEPTDDGLVGWVATSPTALKRRHLEHSPHVAITYWDPTQDTASAVCRATWVLDDAGRQAVWDRFVSAPPPVGYTPSIIPGWESPTAPAFAGLRLDPISVRVTPGSLLAGGSGTVQTWKAP